MAYFSNLNYTLGDEDTLVEHQLLPQNAGHIVAIAGSGGRIVPLIAKRPKIITCVDILQEQLDLTEMRVEAIRQLPFSDFMALFGYPEYPVSTEQRQALFGKLQLRQQTQSRLQAFFQKSGWQPIIYLGKFEKMLITVSKLIRFVVGNRLDVMFEFDDLHEQRNFVKSNAFPHKRWQLALALFGNATALNALLYRGDFPQKNRKGSTFSIYRNMFSDLFNQVLCKESYFFQMLILGRLVNARTSMMEANEAIYKDIKENLTYTQVRYAQTDIVTAINGVDDAVDFVSMSDVPSFMPDDSANTFLNNIAPNLTESGMVVSRGHLRVIHPDSQGFNDISTQLVKLFGSERTGLWQIQCYQKQ
ncbi:DUF3419 family protein [Aestuariibacter sp. AA17]|uniref:DUF3419 family protein n=1 Tax=Fluctibacter corallii TaxID=2984329 RepID=A0ABT3A815_9ALTE|nr:DUF3419 family protein [Aestuariibacter sp. AA17]MCV2884820.1 DUF3419 family protein [Aestuariibacter sp. AA17]